MTEIIQRKHPGVFIKKSLDSWNMSAKEFAIRSNISERTLSDIINGKGSITFDVASKLASYFDNTIEFWINLQTQYNVYLGQEQIKKGFEEDYKCIKTVIPYLKNIKILNDDDDKLTTVIKTRLALNINKLTILNEPNTFVSLKELHTNKLGNEMEKNLWISYALTLARKQEVNTYNKNTLLGYLPEIREMTTQKISTFLPRLKEILSECGICYVLLPYLSKSNIYGATKWLNNSTVMLAMSNRTGRLDSFWFTLFHELAHVTFEHKRYMLLNYEGDIDVEADNFAKNQLIHQPDWDNFIKENTFDVQSIIKFAKSISIHPCIVLGRLEKEKIIPFGKFEKEIVIKYNIFQ